MVRATDSGGNSKRVAEAGSSAVSADPGRLEKRIKTAPLHTAEADTKPSASLPEEQKIFTHVSVFSKPSDFNVSTWSMVDLEHRPHITQGATPLVARCMRAYTWSEKEARKILKAYRQFLELKKIKGDWNAEILSPFEEVDLMWHQHILDVVNYCHDCMLLCGHVVGHNPDGGLSSDARRERLNTTRAALREHFGEEAGEHHAWPTIDESSIAPTELITVCIRTILDEVTCFRIRLDEPLVTLFDAYGRLKQVDRHHFRFVHCGEQFDQDQTARMREFRDQELIFCIQLYAKSD
jgi:hypothetical protein